MIKKSKSRRKPGTNYVAGRGKEYAAMHYLENVGYSVMRSAGSHGVFDLHYWDGTMGHYVQVKYNCYFENEDERQTFLNAIIPFNSVKETWVYIKGYSKPLVMKEEVVKNVKTFAGVCEIASAEWSA